MKKPPFNKQTRTNLMKITLGDVINKEITKPKPEFDGEPGTEKFVASLHDSWSVEFARRKSWQVYSIVRSNPAARTRKFRAGTIVYVGIHHASQVLMKRRASTSPISRFALYTTWVTPDVFNWLAQGVNAMLTKDVPDWKHLSQKEVEEYLTAEQAENKLDSSRLFMGIDPGMDSMMGTLSGDPRVRAQQKNALFAQNYDALHPVDGTTAAILSTLSASCPTKKTDP